MLLQLLKSFKSILIVRKLFPGFKDMLFLELGVNTFTNLTAQTNKKPHWGEPRQMLPVHKYFFAKQVVTPSS
jgi:hypothetical protein